MIRVPQPCLGEIVCETAEFTKRFKADCVTVNVVKLVTQRLTPGAAV